MKRRTVLIAGGVGLVLAIALGVTAYIASSTGVIPRDVVSGGGGRSETSSGYVLQSTMGQPVAAVSTASNGTSLYGGFQIPAAPVTAARSWELY